MPEKTLARTAICNGEGKLFKSFVNIPEINKL